MPVLFEDLKFRTNLLPFTYTRHIADIRVGILTIREKWDHDLDEQVYLISSSEMLSAKYSNTNSYLFINSSVLPTPDLCNEINALSEGACLKSDDIIVALKFKNPQTFDISLADAAESVAVTSKVSLIQDRWDIFLQNEKEISNDFERVTRGKVSASVSDTNVITGNPEHIFIDASATVEGAFLNPMSGRIYIGPNATVMEGSCLRGSIALCESATLKMGSKVYGASTLGPYVKCGGEVSNSVLFGYSNKAHDGFLGNSVIGEWCNLGADTNVSNLKNNYSEIKVWDYGANHFRSSGLQFCGLSMGDHSKCGINTMFNTGTVIGVAANIFGGDFPPKFIPSFSWGSADGFKEFRLKEALKLAETVMARRSIKFDTTDKKIMKELFNSTKRYRKT
ncbi:MAG: glucose-1-phosphate thymidylyltransferase [Chitinophagales bacterium]|nr:glucose-1-phosphate thymidylyltransferase [Chitinophagales bacterium]